MGFLITAVIAALVTTVTCAIVLRVALRHRLYSEPRERDVHSVATPRLGGVAMFVGALTATLVAAVVPELRPGADSVQMTLGVLGGATIVVIVGVFDDLYDLDWMLKLGAQLLAAGVLAAQGVQILSLPFGDTLIVASPTVNFVITVLLIVTVMNAVNFIDGMDGLAAGVALIGSGTFFVYTRILAAEIGNSSAVTLSSVIAAIVFGVCAGFLPWNWHRAKLFMGDTGALLLGLLLAASAIAVTGHLNPGALDQKLVLAGYIPIILPLALLALPLLDMLLAVLRRLRAGQSPFRPDRKHLHHRLLSYGHSHRQAVLLFYLATATLSVSCLLVFMLRDYVVPGLVLVAGVCVCAAVLFLPAERFWGRLRLGRKVSVAADAARIGEDGDRNGE